MTFDEVAKTLRALQQVVAELGGDQSALAGTESFLRAAKAGKAPEFVQDAKKAVKDGLRLPKATEVRAGAASQALDALNAVLKASGADAAALKPVSELKSFFSANASISLEALAEAMAEARRAPKAAAQTATKTASKTSSKPVAKAGRAKKA